MKTCVALATAIGLITDIMPAFAHESASPPIEIAIPDTSQLIPVGWRETVVSVTDLDEMVAFYMGVLGWEVRASGTVDPAQIMAWSLPGGASARFALVGNPGSSSGYVRIVDFDGVEQRRVREHDQAWETGGIYNMNVRVTDMEDIARKVTAAGWQAPSAPVTFTFGPFIVKEWIPRHRDGVRMAFIERVQPPIEGFPNLVTSSRTFNSTQMVTDMDQARAFYQGVLGFETYLVSRAASKEPGEHVLGMSREQMTSVVRDVWIVNPRGAPNEGSVELIEYEGASGRDFSQYASPPNLGNLILRYPVPDLDALVAYLAQHDVPPLYAPTTRQLAPYGQVRITAIRAPDGAMLEFFQEL